MTIRKSEDLLRARAKVLKLHGMLAHWDEISETGWIESLIQWEEQERARRGLERRLKSARLGRFKPLADFDWSWPGQCDREAVNDLMQLNFLNQAAQLPPQPGNDSCHLNFNHYSFFSP